MLAISLSTAACASGIRLADMPTAAEIPALESRLAADSTHFPTLLRLGVAYRDAERLQDARQILERARARQPKHPAATAYLGLTYEELELPGEAHTLYEEYLRTGVSREVQRVLRQRVALLSRLRLRSAAREKLAREAELSSADPTPRTVAVFPFLYSGSDPQFAPLRRALAEMLVTDLSQTGRLTVLERAEVQTLLDEMKLGESGRVDRATSAQAGRLLRAERLVQGEISGDAERLRLGAAVVSSRGEREETVAPEEDVLRRLFDMEKNLALKLYRSLGIELTEAERTLVNRHATNSLPALVAFGRCLEAEDRGQFTEAAAHCAEAARLDPGFAAARERADLLEEIAAAAELSPAQFRLLVDADVALPDEFVGVELIMPPGTVRDPAVESVGVEGVRRNGFLDIVIRRP